jgi:ADP-heptose:LPS heptosyltransferase
MEPHIYRKQWLSLKKSPELKDSLHQLSRMAAFSFIDRYYQRSSYVPEYIDLLCEMATSFTQTELNNIAASALFEIIVEKICDDYEDMPVEVYSRIMSQIVTNCRNTPAGSTLDKRLSEFGIHSLEDIYNRAEFIHTRQYSYNISKPPKKIILLSRVTIGADVAILSVMVQRLMEIFPQTEIVMLGNAKLTGIFGGHKRIRICPLHYARRGGLFERFSSWHASLEILSQHIAPDYEENILVIDPDSRISQLGVLPLCHTDNYLFFNSRKSIPPAKNLCMAELTNHWMDTVFGKSEFCYPKIWTPLSIKHQAGKISSHLHATGCKKIIAINFGCGGNPRKRLGIDFEKRLLQEILNTPCTVVLLDKGFGDSELFESDRLLNDLREKGLHVVNTRFNDSKYPNLSHGLVGLECAIGEVAALIAESDEYIGYDSACQHIAAAAQTPTLTIFAGINNMNFIRRWSACGNTQCKIIHVNTLDNSGEINTTEVVMRIMEERALMAEKLPRQKQIIREIKSTSHIEEAVPKASQS